MAEALSSRDRRALLVGAVTIGSVVLMALGYPRYRAWRSVAMDGASIATAELALAERSVAGFTGTSAALANARSQRGMLDTLLLTGGSAAGAAAALSNAISDAAESAEADLGSVTVQQDSTKRSVLTHFRARASLSGDVGTIAAFLDALEAGPPLVAVREWAISAGAASTVAGQPETLRMDVLVEGIWNAGTRTPR